MDPETSAMNKLDNDSNGPMCSLDGVCSIGANPVVVDGDGRDRASSMEAIPVAGDDAGCGGTKHGDFQIMYAAIPDLPAAQLAALKKIDVDNSGSVSLEELLFMEKTNRNLGKSVCFLAFACLLLCGALFGVSWAVNIMSRPTDVDNPNNAMTRAGTQDIVATADAKETIPMNLASLLSTAALSGLKEVQVKNFKEIIWLNTDPANATYYFRNCLDCPKTFLLKVGSVMHYNESMIEFHSAPGGPRVRVDQGAISVTNMPDMPGRHFMPCGDAGCSSIKVDKDDADLKTLVARAKELRFYAYICNPEVDADCGTCLSVDEEAAEGGDDSTGIIRHADPVQDHSRRLMQLRNMVSTGRYAMRSGAARPLGRLLSRRLLRRVRGCGAYKKCATKNGRAPPRRP